jgi:hypothetical protein
MQKPKETNYDRARRLIDELAASGTCVDYIDVQNAAKGRGLDREVDDLLVARGIRDEVDEMCRKARKHRRP